MRSKESEPTVSTKPLAFQPSARLRITHRESFTLSGKLSQFAVPASQPEPPPAVLDDDGLLLYNVRLYGREGLISNAEGTVTLNELLSDYTLPAAGQLFQQMLQQAVWRPLKIKLHKFLCGKLAETGHVLPDFTEGGLSDRGASVQPGSNLSGTV